MKFELDGAFTIIPDASFEQGLFFVAKLTVTSGTGRGCAEEWKREVRPERSIDRPRWMYEAAYDQRAT
jgi:hypothetical protein